MAEEAQEVMVQHDAQPQVCELEIATTDEVADAVTAVFPGNVTVEIEPAAE